MISDDVLDRVRALGLTNERPQLTEPEDPDSEAPSPVWGHPFFDLPNAGGSRQTPVTKIDALTTHSQVSLRVADPGLGDSRPDWEDLEGRLPDLRRYRPHALEAGERAEATELLAWYRPFHFEPQRAWGIYFRDIGVLKVARALQPLTEPASGWPTLNDLIAEALQLLHLHEAFHHVTEVAATALEFIASEQSTVPRALYVPYTQRDYRPWLHGPDPELPLEEALANAYAYNRLKRGVKRRAALFMRAQPPGYRDFHRHTNEHTHFRSGLGRLHGLLRGVGDTAVEPLETLFDLAPLKVVTHGVPTYLVHEVPDPALALGFHLTFESRQQLRDKRLEKDLKNRADWARLVDRFQEKLAAGWTPGTDLAPMCGDWYRAKLQDGLRVVLQTEGSVIHLRRALGHDDYMRFRQDLCR